MHACMRMFKACGLAGYYGADYFRNNDNIICWWIHSISWSVPESDVRRLMKWDVWTGHRVTVVLWTCFFLDALHMGFTNDFVMLILAAFLPAQVWDELWSPLCTRSLLYWPVISILPTKKGKDMEEMKKGSAPIFFLRVGLVNSQDIFISLIIKSW